MRSTALLLILFCLTSCAREESEETPPASTGKAPASTATPDEQSVPEVQTPAMTEPQLEEEPPPAEAAVAEEIPPREPTIADYEVAETQDLSTKESAFDSNQWNSAVGLGGGAGGAYGGRNGRGSVDGDRYEAFEEHGYIAVVEQPLSTFSVDVDTASYANVRRRLRESQWPRRNSVRVEELINYFRYGDAKIDSDHPFGVMTELAACPWQSQNRLLRVTLRAKDIDVAEAPPRNLVFLIDRSGSMRSADKLPLLVRSLHLLVDRMRDQDRIAIVCYAGNSGIALGPTTGKEKHKIKQVLDGLGAGGSTHGSAGITTAYDLVRKHFVEDGINRIILATDGDFNVGLSHKDSLTELIEKERESGAFLSVLGFGRGNLRDDFCERLADKGNGNYSYIDSIAEARKVLVTEAGSTIHTLAKDVKIQIEFNPRFVKGYRQIGYENRKLAAKDFNDDKKDAGEIGSGHQVTAIYEITPIGANGPQPAVDPLKYQKQVKPEALADDATSHSEFCNVKLRYKQPDGDKSELITHPVAHSETLAQSSPEFEFATAVAAFGMLLRDSEFKGSLTWDTVLELAQSGRGKDLHGYRAEFIQLARMAKDLASTRKSTR